MQKAVNKKNIYLLLLLVISLIGLVVTPTYAKFSDNYQTENDVVGISLDFSLGITNIEEYDELVVAADSTEEFNIVIENASSSTMYYGAWYKIADSSYEVSNLSISKSNASSASTSGSIAASSSVTVTVTITNNSTSEVKIYLGVSSSISSTSNIEYLNGKKLIPSYHTQWRYRDYTVESSGYVFSGNSPSASATKNSGTDNKYGKYYLKLVLTETELGNNYSKVKYTVSVVCTTSGNGFLGQTVSFTLTLNGTNYTGSKYYSNCVGLNVSGYSCVSTAEVASGTVTINHNTDGTKTVSYSLTGTGNGGYSPGTMTLSSQSLTLTPALKWEETGHWGDWSEWSDTEYTASDTREVETRFVND